MCDQWMPAITLKLTAEEFHQLPQNPAYRYEYGDGLAYLTPRSKHYHAVFDLEAWAAFTGPLDQSECEVKPATAAAVLSLAPLFAGAFFNLQPFGCLDDDTRLEAARQSLERTVSGGDGPWIPQASFVAHAENNVIGAILITLLPLGDPCEWDTYYWTEPPPENAVERRLGKPHLTWIFVAPLHAGLGVGTALLGAAARELLSLGFTELLSTFISGNDSSLLWHWRNGFRLLSYPGSRRLLRQRWAPTARSD